VTVHSLEHPWHAYREDQWSRAQQTSLVIQLDGVGLEVLWNVWGPARLEREGLGFPAVDLTWRASWGMGAGPSQYSGWVRLCC
jgi:hypothetical protein